MLSAVEQEMTCIFSWFFTHEAPTRQVKKHIFLGTLGVDTEIHHNTGFSSQFEDSDMYLEEKMLIPLRLPLYTSWLSCEVLCLWSNSTKFWIPQPPVLQVPHKPKIPMHFSTCIFHNCWTWNSIHVRKYDSKRWFYYTIYVLKNSPYSHHPPEW